MVLRGVDSQKRPVSAARSRREPGIGGDQVEERLPLLGRLRLEGSIRSGRAAGNQENIKLV